MRLEELLQKLKDLLPIIEEYEVEILVGALLILVGLIILIKLFGRIRRSRSPW